MSFTYELQQLINRHSKENESNTPDFVLASFISMCLIAWNDSVILRDKWYGFNPWPGRDILLPAPDPDSSLLDNSIFTELATKYRYDSIIGWAFEDGPCGQHRNSEDEWCDCPRPWSDAWNALEGALLQYDWGLTGEIREHNLFMSTSMDVAGFDSNVPQVLSEFARKDLAMANHFETADSVEMLLGMLAGAASTCWLPHTGDLEFDSSQASKFVDDAVEQLNQIIIQGSSIEDWHGTTT
jgi:hypothetical protein